MDEQKKYQDYQYQKYQEIQKELNELADKVQTSSSSNEQYRKEMGSTVESLQKIYNEMLHLHKNTNQIVVSLDKDRAVQEERNSNIFYQIGRLEKRLEELERSAEKSDDKTRQMSEKIVMLVIGALVTWLFNALQNS